MKDISSRLDWIHLPLDSKTFSLWECLHDGELVSVSSNLLERTVRLVFDVPYLRTFHDLPDDLTFAFELKGVSSARVVVWAAWPGEIAQLEGRSREEQTRLVAEYHAKWREESESWSAFEARIGRSAPEIRDADVAISGEESGVALRIGIMDGNAYFEAIVRADGLDLSRSDGQALDLSRFQELGRLYWEAWASGSS
jgi:hypothetical protein